MMSEATLLPLVSKPVTFSCSSSRSGAGAVRSRSAAATTSAGACSACPALVARVAPDGTGRPATWTGSSSGRRRTRVPLSLSRSISSSSINNSNNRVVRHNTNDPAVSCNSVGYRNYTSSSRSSGSPVCRTNSTGSASRVTATMGSSNRGSGNSSHTPSNSDTCCRSTAASNRSSCAMRRNGARRSHTPVEVHSVMYRTDNTLLDMRQWPRRCSSLGPAATLHALESSSTRSDRRRCRSEEAKQTQPCFCLTWKTVCTGERRGGRKSSLPARTTNAPSVPVLSLAPAAAPTEGRRATYVPQAALATRCFSTVLPAAAVIPAAACLPLERTPASAAAAGRVLHVCEKKRQRLRGQQPVPCASGHHEEGAASAATASATSGGTLAHPTCMYVPSGTGTEQPQRPQEEHSGSNRGQGGGQHSQETHASPGWVPNSVWLSVLPHTKPQSAACGMSAGADGGVPPATPADASDGFVAASDTAADTGFLLEKSTLDGPAASVNYGGRAAASLVDSGGPPPTSAASARCLAPSRNGCTGAPVAGAVRRKQQDAGGSDDHVDGAVAANSISEGEQESVDSEAGEGPAETLGSGEGGAAATMWGRGRGDEGGGGRAPAAATHAAAGVGWRAAARRSAAEAAAGSVTAGAAAASGAARRPAVRSRLRRHPTDLSEGNIAWVGEEGRGGGVEAMDQARQGAPTTAAQDRKQPPVSWGTGTAMHSAESAAGSGIRSCASPEGNFFLRRPQTLRPQRQGRQLGQGPEGGETEELEEKEQGEEGEDGDEDGNDSKTSGTVSRGERKDRGAAEKCWGLLGGLLERLRSSSRNSVRAALVLGEDFRKKLLQQKAQLESGKRLSGRCFFYLLLTFFLVLLALVLLLGTLQHEHKLYRLRPRQVLLLQQHTQRQLQQRMQQQQKQQQRNTHDSAWQQRFFEAVLRVPVPPLRPCAHGAPAAAGAARPQSEWLHSSAAASASACLLGEDACSRGMPEVGTSSPSRHQSCPKTEDAALLPPAAPATAGDVPADRRGALFFATRTRAFVPWKTSRSKPAGATTFTGRKASAWRGIDTLGVCCVPLVLCPYSTAASDKRSHCKQPAASTEAATIGRDFIRTHGSDHRFSTSHASRPPAAAGARAAAFTSAVASAGDLSAATAAADVEFPGSVFFFSLRGHPPPLSFLDPASPVLVCAEADERQLLLRLLLQLVRPFRAASDAVRGLLQLFHPFVASSSTAQQQNPQQQSQQDQRQQHTLLQQQQHAEQREQSPVQQQQQQTETEILRHTTQQERRSVSAAAQEGAAEAPCSGTLCCVAVPTGGVCSNISEEIAAAGETTPAAAEQGSAASEEPQTDSALAEWETQVVRVLAEGSACCLYAADDASSPSSCGLVREKLPMLQEQKRGPAAGAPGVPVAARDAAAARSFLQEEKEATAPAVLSRLGEGEEPRLQVYAQTLRAAFNGLLPQYTQIRFAALSTEAAVLLYNFPGNAAGAAPPDAAPPDAAPPGAVVTSPASAVSSRLAVTQQTRGALLSLFWPVSTTPPVPGAIPSSGVSSPAAALSSTGVPPAARSPPRCAAGAGSTAPSFPVSSVSSALLTRLSSLLPAETSLYFSFSSYLSPCYPFSRFLHRRLVGWGGLQLHILLFGGWFHSLFAAEPLTLVHAPRAAFLFVLAAYRGLILYEAFSSLEAHYFRRAHTLQQQEHLRAAAAAAAVEEYDAGTQNGGGFAGRDIEKETGETELCADILFEREEDLRLLLQHRQAVQCARGNARHDSSCRDKSSSSSSRNSRGSGYPLDGEGAKQEQEEEGPQQQQHGSERTKENETGGRRESCSRTRNTEDEGEFVVAAAAWTDFSDHVVLYVLVAIFAAMEIAAARSSHTRPRATPAAGSSSSTGGPTVCCSSSTKACSASNCCSSSVNSSNRHHSSSNSSSSGNQLAGRCQDGASSEAGDASSVDSLFPSSALTTPASDQYYEKTLQQLAAGANGFNFAASGHQLQLTAGDAATAAKLGARVVAAGESAAAAAAYFSPSGTNNNSGTESTGRQAGTGKLYVVVWVYYGFLLLCCLHMAFYTACFFHTPQEIWSGLGVGLLFLVLPLVVACEILEKPTLQRLGIGSGERRAAKQGAGAAEAAHGEPAGGSNSSREPTGSSKRFTGPETAGIAMKEVEDEEEEEEEEEMGFREDRLSSSSSLSVHSRSSSSSSNCSRLRERAAAAGEARLFPAYRRRPHFFCSSSGSNSSHGGTSPLPAIPQRHLQQIAFHHLSRATRTRSNHGRRREESSSSHLHRGRNRSSSFMTPAAAAPSGRGMRKYCYDARDSLLQQHEDTVTIR